MRTDITFDAEGTILRGWLYLPDKGQEPFPLVVMAHGWGAVKEMYLDLYADAFATAGLATLVYDHRNFGASDGLPRQEIDPWAQMRDYRHAITFATTLPQVDSARIGVWGTSYSGGHVLVVGALDARVACVVSQVPTISGGRNTARRFPGDTLTALRGRFDADRHARFHGGAPAMVPVVAELNAAEVGTPAATTSEVSEPIGNDGAQWFRAMPPERRAAWRNELTLRSIEMYAEYEPGGYIERIGPTPLLMITADADTLTPTDEILAAYGRAREPKQLLIVPGGHYDIYGTQRGTAIAAAREWFLQHLQPRPTSHADPVGRESVRQRLLGTWRLVSWEARDAAGAMTYPLGEDAAGQIVYDATGRMSAQFMRRNQPRFAHEDWQQAATDEKAAAWSGYFGYFGTYTLDEQAGVVTHHVEGSWFPNLVGTDQRRSYRFEGDRLALDADTAWGRVRIVWEKASVPQA